MVASLRIALAVATSFIAAETALFLVFAPEITRAGGLYRAAESGPAHRSDPGRREDAGGAALAQRAQLSGAADPDVRTPARPAPDGYEAARERA